MITIPNIFKRSKSKKDILAEKELELQMIKEKAKKSPTWTDYLIVGVAIIVYGIIFGILLFSIFNPAFSIAALFM